ncbi:occludin isoform X1 [Petaurus breviceps papuanus]|uniref:occludin isoform X1 n=2 Tax=Petaurus breviceps papuanus TaxID=3040969 RepID=UPI0036D849DD
MGSVCYVPGSPLPMMYEKRSYTGYGHPSSRYDYPPPSGPPGSFYLADVPPQHFYQWRSPPGIARILQGSVIILCLVIFACVASTLAWDYYGSSGLLGYGGGLGSYYNGYYGGYNGYYYGGLTNPRAANGFMIAMAVLCFLVTLGLVIAGLSKAAGARSRRFYLLVTVLSGLLAFVMLIASIVYVVGVNPRAGLGSSSGSLYYNQMLMLCNQMMSPVSGGIMNQYLYHYCMVDPQEAVAIVCGFLTVVLLCVICYFAQKTRHKIWKYGKPNIFWDKPLATAEGPNVEEWVKNVSGDAGTQDETATLAYSEKPTSPLTCAFMPAQENGYGHSTPSSPRAPPPEGSSPPEEKDNGSVSRPPARRGRRQRLRPTGLEESQYETDYTTAAESSGEGDRDDWASLYPPITSDAIRQTYKAEFNSDLQRYKALCAEMDSIGAQLRQLSQELDCLPEGSLRYQGVAEEYNRLKDLKRSPEYQSKKLETQSLRDKLCHIKRMVGAYDQVRS